MQQTCTLVTADSKEGGGRGQKREAEQTEKEGWKVEGRPYFSPCGPRDKLIHLNRVTACHLPSSSAISAH